MLNLIYRQKVTGYAVIGTRKGEWFRTLDGANALTRQVLEFEKYGLVTVDRTRPIRYELTLTEAGRKLALRYRAKSFTVY